MQNIAQALLIVGTREEVRRAEEIIRNVENQMGSARDKIVFWYTAKHSEAEELASVLYRVYSLMITTGTGIEASSGKSDIVQNKVIIDHNAPAVRLFLLSHPKGNLPLFFINKRVFTKRGVYIVNPAPAQPQIFEPTLANNERGNFIVDVKTGAIVMVVEADILPKIKDLIRKLDVPKKMVQIETLLFEKVLNRENSVGLICLKLAMLL